MSELQNDDYIEQTELESNEEVAEVEDDQPSELAPDSEPQHEENSVEPEQNFNQEAVNKVINRKHYEAQEAKRKAKELERKLAQYEAQTSQAPLIPQKPDPFDDDYDAKMVQYEQAVIAKARHDANQEVLQRQQQEQQQRQQYEQQQKLQQDLQRYVESGKKAGMSVEEMTQAGQIVDSYGVGVDLQQALIADEDGALIVKHLAANPAMAAELASMTPYQAALHLERAVRPAAKQLKPKTTSAPNPPKRLQGGDVDPELGQYKNVNGSFE